MKLWEKQQRHEIDVNKILRESGCLDNKNKITRYNGRVVIPKLIEKGHTKLSFDLCECKIRKD